MPYSGLLHPEPLSLQKSAADPYLISSIQFNSVAQSCWLFVIPWTTACQASLSITDSQSLPELMSTELVMPSNHLILHHPLLPLPSIFPNIRVFSNESALHIRWPKYWSFSFKIYTSSGDTQTQFCLSLCVVSGSWYIEGIFELFECLWQVWALILNMVSPLLPSCWGFSFALGHGVSPQNQQCRVRENEKKNSRLVILQWYRRRGDPVRLGFWVREGNVLWIKCHTLSLLLLRFSTFCWMNLFSICCIPLG